MLKTIFVPSQARDKQEDNKAFFSQAAAFRVGDKDGRGGLSKLEAQATIQDHFQQHGSAKDAPTLEYIGSLFETFDFDRSGAETALSLSFSFCSKQLPLCLSRACLGSS